jgi:hypothetical protein
LARIAFIVVRISALISLLTRRFHKTPAQPRKRITIVKAVLAVIAVVMLIGYGNFFYATQFWIGFKPSRDGRCLLARRGGGDYLRGIVGGPLPQQPDTTKPSRAERIGSAQETSGILAFSLCRPHKFPLSCDRAVTCGLRTQLRKKP